MMGMVYQWRAHSRCPVPVQIVGEEIDRIREEGGNFFTPGAVVEAARDADSPLHPAFDWDDQVAAEHWRVEQAKYLIRNVVVVRDNSPGKSPVREFVSVTVAGEGPRYTTVAYAMATPVLRERVLADAMNEMRAFQRKYAALLDLSRVVEEFERAHARASLSQSSEAA